MLDTNLSAKNLSEIESGSETVIIVGLCLWLAPMVAQIVCFVLAPGFVMPFFSQPTIIIGFILVFLIHSFLCGLLCQSGFLRWTWPAKVSLGLTAGASAVFASLFPSSVILAFTLFQAIPHLIAQ
jgi:hypothetical protein